MTSVAHEIDGRETPGAESDAQEDKRDEDGSADKVDTDETPPASGAEGRSDAVSVEEDSDATSEWDENDPGVMQEMLGDVLQDIMLSGQTPENAENPRCVELCQAFMTLAKHVCGESRVAASDAPALLDTIYKSAPPFTRFTLGGDAERFPKRRRHSEP